jgi:hypothetical protein
MKPEESYRAKIDPFFEKYFDVDREVSSDCGKYRIDYLLRCKESNAVFGVEVKSEVRKRGRDFALYIKQAQNYRSAYWNSKRFGLVNTIVFITPAVSNFITNVNPDNCITIPKNGLNVIYAEILHPLEHPHNNFHTFLGELCEIGEIKSFTNNTGNHFQFIYRGKTIWSSLNKLHKKNHETYFIPK